MRLALTPCCARYPLTAVARRAPSAMLYSRVPRSSAWPSMVTVYCGYWLSQTRLLAQDALRFAGQGRAVHLEMDDVADIDGEILAVPGVAGPSATDAIFLWRHADSRARRKGDGNNENARNLAGAVNPTTPTA